MPRATRHKGHVCASHMPRQPNPELARASAASGICVIQGGGPLHVEKEKTRCDRMDGFVRRDSLRLTPLSLPHCFTAPSASVTRSSAGVQERDPAGKETVAPREVPPSWSCPPRIHCEEQVPKLPERAGIGARQHDVIRQQQPPASSSPRNPLQGY